MPRGVIGQNDRPLHTYRRKSTSRGTLVMNTVKCPRGYQTGKLPDLATRQTPVYGFETPGWSAIWR